MIDLSYPNILNLFTKHLDKGKRSESASFLIWYLENYFRLDELDAVDSVCDQRGDKGIDGLYFNEGENTLYILQSKISQKEKSSIGDSDLREFYGTMEQLRTKEGIDIVLGGSGNELLKTLIRRIELREKVSSCEIRGIFLANLELDTNGSEYLRHTPDIQFIGKHDLIDSYVPVGRSDPINAPITFDLSGYGCMEYVVDATTRCYVATIHAKDLIKLPGISNQSIFDLNVRGPLGKTKVNRDIESSLKEASMHKAFPLYHNGITMICGEANLNNDRLSINKYYVVNGCQSLTVLYRNSKHLSDDLRILVRIVKLDTSSDLADRITTISNNQNGVKSRDFKSNHPVQVRLQNEMQTIFSGRYQYEVKRGEKQSAPLVITNEKAGLQLIAFDLKEPWTTHRIYQVFDDKYGDIFARPDVTAYRLVMLDKIFRAIESKIDKIENHLFGQYALTKYLILFIMRRLLENDETGKQILTNPAMIFADTQTEAKFDRIVELILSDIAIDLNEETKSLDANFDYRGKLRDKEYVLKFTSDIVASYEKQIQRKRVPSINEEWKK